jgi:hypothetical protein
MLCMESTESPEHSIEFVAIPTWQAGTIHQARCECGWKGERLTDREVVEAEAQRHLNARSEQA